MYLNNTIDALDLTTKTGMFPNGRTLLNSFTGWTRLDLNMATLVCFFDGMTDGSDPGTKLLYMDVVGTLHTAILWFMLQILRAPKPQSISLLLYVQFISPPITVSKHTHKAADTKPPDPPSGPSSGTV